MRRSTEVRQYLSFGQLDTKPKIDYLDVQFVINEDVFHFYISVGDVFLVKVIKSRKYLFGDTSQSRLINFFQIFSLNILSNVDTIEQFGYNINAIFLVNGFIKLQ